jgi:hypothetical protein
LEINKLSLLHLVGFFYIILPTLMMHGQTQIKHTNIELNENPSMGTELLQADGRTNRHRQHDEVIIRFSQFLEGPKN